MAVDLSKLVSKRRLAFEELNNKTIAIDAYNVLYQFLSIIRGPDGTPLMDSHGNVTSHLSGIFYRTIEIIGYGIKPIYVFDGLPSMLKQKTIEARMQRREAAYEEWQKAVKEGELDVAKSKAQASTRVDKRIVESSKQLLDFLGVPYINAPSEGEAQASWMCKKGAVDITASQDYDTLLFGSPLIIRNLTFSGRRKLPGKNIFVDVAPELVDLKDTLKSLGVTHDQLIWIGILLGTDFNMGIKGVGPKTALKMAKNAKRIEDIERQVKERFDAEFELDIREVVKLFKEPEVKEMGKPEVEGLLKKHFDKEGLVRFMCDEHGFSKDRIEKYSEKLEGKKAESRQKGIEGWFK